LGATRKLDGPAVEALQALSEHWAIDLPAKAGCDMNDPAWIDSQDVAVVGKMVNRAQRESVDDRGDASRVRVADDVRRLDEGLFAKRADRTSMPRGTRSSYSAVSSRARRTAASRSAAS